VRFKAIIRGGARKDAYTVEGGREGGGRISLSREIYLRQSGNLGVDGADVSFALIDIHTSEAGIKSCICGSGGGKSGRRSRTRIDLPVKYGAESSRRY